MSTSSLTFSKYLRASAMKIGPDEINGTMPIRILVAAPCAQSEGVGNALDAAIALVVLRNLRRLTSTISSSRAWRFMIAPSLQFRRRVRKRHGPGQEAA